MLLAEANQWPADVVDYFGDGDECHMCFHFPLMPRMFMAVRREQRYPITEILAQTPDIPEGCQWGIFLRNHDELTLEMVTDEERDYMYAEYAKDPRMKRNVGISPAPCPAGRQRPPGRPSCSTPCCSRCPGSPVLYYGDEIGMGDNIYLGDRDGVRTPMQWTPDRNGGFSKADFAQLYLPPLMDPVYGYQAVNVEAQLRDPSSFLHWVQADARGPQAAPGVRHRHVRGARRREPVGARLPAAKQGDDIVLCVNNLSRSPSRSSSTLQHFDGQDADRAARAGAVPADRRAAVLRHPGALRLLLVPAGGHAVIETRRRWQPLLAAYLAQQRWFARRPAADRRWRWSIDGVRAMDRARTGCWSEADDGASVPAAARAAADGGRRPISCAATRWTILGDVDRLDGAVLRRRCSIPS